MTRRVRLRKRHITLIATLIILIAGYFAGPDWPRPSADPTDKGGYADALNPTRSSGDVKGTQTSRDPTTAPDTPATPADPAPPVTVEPGSETYVVSSVSDGDTIRIVIDGRKQTVRLIGVDTPETSRPNTPVQCYGRQATAYAKELIGNGPVRLASDLKTDDKDRYGRLLRYVYLLDGRLVQHELLRNGYAFAYTSFPFTRSEEFSGLQQTARDAKTGIWRDCQPRQLPNGTYTTGTDAAGSG